MLTFDKVEVQQGDFKLKVDDQLAVGFVSVIGPSGSGKSTLLSTIAGFSKLSLGQLYWSDNAIGEMSPSERPVSMVFQDNNLFPHLTIAQNVALALEPKLAASETTLSKVDAVLEEVGLTAMGSRKPSELSGGQQSRTALARVLLSQKPIVLLDEPFAALGPGLRQEMLELVKKVLHDRLVIMVTHDPRDAQTFAGRTVLIDDGFTSKSVETTSLFADPPDSLKKYLGQ